MKKSFTFTMLTSCVMLVASCMMLAASCMMPVGTRVGIVVADGIIDVYEKEILIELAKRKTVVRQGTVPFYYLLNHFNDMAIFIRKYVYKDWPNTEMLYFKIVETKKELKKLWSDCNKGCGSNIHFEPGVVGFYCPNNYTIILLKRDVQSIVNDYNHEEGHYVNYIDDTTSEFPAEFCRLWKIFIRMAMDEDLGHCYFDKLYQNKPDDNDNETIASIGMYKSGALMFFFVMNHFNCDLTKSAKFMFESSSKKLKKFFYKNLKRYRDKTNRQIWEEEVIKMLNNKKLYENIKNVRKNHV